MQNLFIRKSLKIQEKKSRNSNKQNIMRGFGVVVNKNFTNTLLMVL